jgi:hypothetical protein
MKSFAQIHKSGDRSVPKHQLSNAPVRTSAQLMQHPAIIEIIRREPTSSNPQEKTQADILMNSPQVPQAMSSAALSRDILRGQARPTAGDDDVLRGSKITESLNTARDAAICASNHGISVRKEKKALFNAHGVFSWEVAFYSACRNGWIIQEIINLFIGHDVNNKNVKFWYNPHYWEAWSVDSKGRVRPKPTQYNDKWSNEDLRKHGAVAGYWSTGSNLYFTQTDPATQGFKLGNPVKGLLSSTMKPKGLGPVQLSRYASGAWDSSGVKPTHYGVTR